MKKLIPFIITILSMLFLYSCFKANDNIGHEGRCTGSAYCSACTSCSRCGHCSSGGTCGVCSGSSSSKSKPKKYKRSESSTSPKSRKPPKVFIDKVNVNINSNNRYIAGIATVNIYEKPFPKSKIIEKVAKDEKLIRLEKQPNWYKVRVQKSGKTGYVQYKDIK
jgi:uncharacterized protein YgiM (DUF1202 family)